MKKMLIVSLSAAAFAGCVTQYNEPPPPQQPRTIPAESVRIEAPQVSVPTAPQQVVTPPAASQVRKIASWAEKPLRVFVSLDDGQPAEKPTAYKRTIQTNLEGGLARSGYRVVYAKPAEILVYGALRARKVNARGTRVAWTGEADMEITRAPEVNVINGQKMVDVVAKRRFDAKSGDARTDDDAQKILGDRLAGSLTGFAQDGVRKVGGTMRSCSLTVANAWQPQDAPGYPTLFTQRVSAMPGVHACTIIATDNAARCFSAEVVYDSAAYPDGFINRLYLDPELRIVR